MEKNIDKLLKELAKIPEPEHFLRFLRTRLDKSAADIAAEYDADICARNEAREAIKKRAEDALHGLSRDEVLAMISGVESNGIHSNVGVN